MQLTPSFMHQKRVGLLGGSFNPAHHGHREISIMALERLKLDFVVWLVTPGNPQKNQNDYAPIEQRLSAAEACANHPQIMISNYESQHKLTFTGDTLHHLKTHFPSTKFAWLMGGDNLASFHTWRRWEDIAQAVPLAIFSRPNHHGAAMAAPAAKALASSRLPLHAAYSLCDHKAPAWIYFPDIYNRESSTRLRNQALES